MVPNSLNRSQFKEIYLSGKFCTFIFSFLLFKSMMKKFNLPSILILMLWFVNSLSAQDSPRNVTLQYFNKTEIGIGIGFGSFGVDDIRGYTKKVKNDQIIITPQTINGLVISGRAGLGIGVGAEVWQHGMFYPVFAHFFYDLKPGDNTLFAFINLGEDYGKRDATFYYQEGKGGFLFCIGAGYKMKIGKRLQFEYSLFYRYQAIQSQYRTYYDTVPTHFTTTDYKVPYNLAGFKIGVIFK
jgi:hypothetical protein